MLIGNRILNLLYNCNITQKQLSIDLNIAPSTLNGYINNRREPDYDTLRKIAKYFDVSCDYLLGITDTEQFLPEPSFGKEELLLLSYYQTLTADQKELVLQQVKLMDKQNRRKSKTPQQT